MTEPSSAPAGWYQDGEDPRRRFWDGVQWTDQFEESARPPLKNAKVRRSFGLGRQKLIKLPADERIEILNAEIVRWTAKGWKLVTASKLFGLSAILSEPWWRAILRDLLLIVLSAGLWLIYMIYRAMINKTSVKVIEVDRFGRVRTSTQTFSESGGE